jgi:hypothetical protein
MKIIRLFIAVIFIQLLFTGPSVTTLYNEIPDAIINALKEGNSEELAKFFSDNIELALSDKDDIYSKNQAKLIIEDFFTENPPRGFSILHKGGKETSRYAIGNLLTAGGEFRITILLKIKDNKTYINQLRIEKENGE